MCTQSCPARRVMLCPSFIDSATSSAFLGPNLNPAMSGRPNSVCHPSLLDWILGQAGFTTEFATG